MSIRIAFDAASFWKKFVIIHSKIDLKSILIWIDMIKISTSIIYKLYPAVISNYPTKIYTLHYTKPDSKTIVLSTCLNFRFFFCFLISHYHLHFSSYFSQHILGFIWTCMESIKYKCSSFLHCWKPDLCEEDFLR